jgi:hypothetical protein
MKGHHQNAFHFVVSIFHAITLSIQSKPTYRHEKGFSREAAYGLLRRLEARKETKVLLGDLFFVCVCAVGDSFEV